MNKLLLLLLTCSFFNNVAAKDLGLKNLKAPEELRTISEKLVTAVIKQDPKAIETITATRVFDYFQADIDAETDEKTPKSFFQLGQDGYYPYEKESVVFKNKIEIVKNLVSNCEPGFTRKKFPLKKAHFSKIKMISSNRAEIVLKALCDASRVHLVFIENKKTWSFTGYFFESARTE